VTAVNPVIAGLAGRCPNCGEGALFIGFIKVRPRCEVCAFDLGAADSGDGPAVFIIIIVGVIACFGLLFTEVSTRLPIWADLAIWLPFAALLAVGLLRPFKGLMVALQFHNQASEARNDVE